MVKFPSRDTAAGAGKPDSARDALAAAPPPPPIPHSPPAPGQPDSVCASVQWAEDATCPSLSSPGKAKGGAKKTPSLHQISRQNARQPLLTKCPGHWIKVQVLEPRNHNNNSNSGCSNTYTNTFYVLPPHFSQQPSELGTIFTPLYRRED